MQRARGELRRCTSSLLSRMCHGVCRWPRSACRATSRPFVTIVVGFQRLFFSFSSVCRAILSSHSSRHALKNILKTNDNRDKCPSARSTGRFRPPTNAVTTNDNQRHVIATWFYLLQLLDIVRDMKNVLRRRDSFPDLHLDIGVHVRKERGALTKKDRHIVDRELVNQPCIEVLLDCVGSYNSLGVAPRDYPLEDILVEAAGEPKIWLVACSAS